MYEHVDVMLVMICAGDRHIVELAHSTFGGKRTIRVDGIVKISEKKVIDNGSKYHLEAAGSISSRSVMIVVEIKPVGVSGVTYELYVDGRDYDHAKRFWLHQDD
jgi:Fas apoptotic inhibitory molecule (FAIM1)